MKNKLITGKSICIICMVALCFVVCAAEQQNDNIIEVETTINNNDSVTAELETTHPKGFIVETAQYFDYVGYDDQGRLVDKNNIIILDEDKEGNGPGEASGSGQGGGSASHYIETTIDDRTEEEKIRESKYEEALEIIRESKRESEKESQIQYMEDIIKRAEEIKANSNQSSNAITKKQQAAEEAARQQSIEAELAIAESNRNSLIESIRQKTLQESREKERSRQESIKAEALARARSQMQHDTETETIVYNVDKTTKNPVIQTDKVTQQKSVNDNIIPSIIVPQETVQLQVDKLSTNSEAKSVVITKEIIDYDGNNKIGKNIKNDTMSLTENKQQIMKNVGSKNLFTAIKDFFVDTFNKIFHK